MCHEIKFLSHQYKENTVYAFSDEIYEMFITVARCSHLFTLNLKKVTGQTDKCRFNDEAINYFNIKRALRER